MWHRIAASPSASLLAMTSAFIVGIAAHAFDERTWFVPMGGPFVVGAAYIAAFFIRRNASLRLAAICAALCALAVWRYEAAIPPVRPDVLPPPYETSFRGVVVEEPRQAVTGTTVIVATRDAKAELRYRVGVDVAAGETISWGCRMRMRDEAAREKFRRDVAWTCVPREAPVPLVPPPRMSAVLHAARSHVRGIVGASVPEPDASLVLGLLIGDDAGIPRPVAQAFRETGTAHVLAVSGFNVRLLVDALFTAFAVFAVARRRASAAVVVIIAAFAMMTGAESPVVRAACMGCAGIIAVILGRRDAGVTPLLLAAALMLAVEPSALRHDVGFRLSFAAVAGMRVLGPRLFRAFGGDPDAFGVRRSLADTLAATCATLPITLHDFGALPFAAPFVNVVIAPFIPPLMAAGAAVVAAGALLPPLAAAPAVVCVALARPFVRIVTGVADALPAANLPISFATATAMYAVMIAVVLMPPRRPRLLPPAPPDAIITTYAP